MNYQEAYTKLEKYGQLHVLKYYDELGEEEKETLLAQIEQTDFEVLSLCEQKESLNLRGKIEPIAVMQLPEKYRIVIHLYYYEEYAVREIAQILKLSESNVKIRLSRGRAMLKETLKEEWDDDK